MPTLHFSLITDHSQLFPKAAEAEGGMNMTTSRLTLAAIMVLGLGPLDSHRPRHGRPR